MSRRIYSVNVTVVLPSGKHVGPFELSSRISSVDAYRQLIELIGISTNLTNATHLSHAFWFDVKSLDGHHPPEDISCRLNLAGDPFLAQVEEIVGRDDADHTVHLFLRTYHKNLYIDTDLGPKHIDFSKCDFAINTDDAMHAFRNLFHQMLPENAEVYRVEKNFHLRNSVLGIYPSVRLVPWKDANGMKHLILLPAGTSSVRDVIDLDDGFVWEGDHVIDTRACIGPCPKSHTGGTKSLAEAHQEGFRRALEDYQKIHGEIDAAILRRAEKEMTEYNKKRKFSVSESGSASSDEYSDEELLPATEEKFEHSRPHVSSDQVKKMSRKAPVIEYMSDSDSDSDTSSNISGSARAVGRMARQ